MGTEFTNATISDKCWLHSLIGCRLSQLRHQAIRSRRLRAWLDQPTWCPEWFVGRLADHKLGNLCREDGDGPSCSHGLQSRGNFDQLLLKGPRILLFLLRFQRVQQLLMQSLSIALVWLLQQSYIVDRQAARPVTLRMRSISCKICLDYSREFLIT